MDLFLLFLYTTDAFKEVGAVENVTEGFLCKSNFRFLNSSISITSLCVTLSSHSGCIHVSLMLYLEAFTASETLLFLKALATES